MNIGIRRSEQDDLAAIESIYAQAFPDEDLLPLVQDLLLPSVALSLVATSDSRLVGHGVFTRCGVTGIDVKAALLGPLAVTPARQGRGIGGAIVRDGLQRLEDEGVSQVFVLGDPVYYGRFGFLPESGVTPPYALPDEWQGAWQSWCPGGATGRCRGAIALPAAWLEPSLWSP